MSYWSTEVLLHVHYDQCWVEGSYVTHDCGDFHFDGEMCPQLTIKFEASQTELLFNERSALTEFVLSSLTPPYLDIKVAEYPEKLRLPSENVVFYGVMLPNPV